MDFKKRGLFIFVILSVLFISSCEDLQLSPEEAEKLEKALRSERTICTEEVLEYCSDCGEFSNLVEITCWEEDVGCSSHSECGQGEYCHSTGECVTYSDNYCINNDCFLGDGDCDPNQCNTGVCSQTLDNCNFGNGITNDADCCVSCLPTGNECNSDSECCNNNCNNNGFCAVGGGGGGEPDIPVSELLHSPRVRDGPRDTVVIEKELFQKLERNYRDLGLLTPVDRRRVRTTTECRYNPLCRDSCSDGLAGGRSNLIDGDSPECQSRVERQISICKHIFNSEGHPLYSGAQGYGRCSGEQGHTGNIQNPQVVDDEGYGYQTLYYVEVTSYYDSTCSNFLNSNAPCGSQTCYLAKDSYIYNLTYDGSAGFNNVIGDCNNIVYKGDLYCQGFADGLNYVECDPAVDDDCVAGDYTPYYGADSISGYWTPADPLDGWTFEEVETYYNTVFPVLNENGEDVGSHYDCGLGPLSCNYSIPESQTVTCELGDILGGEPIYWLNSTLDGSTPGCSYGNRTRECASDFLYHDTWSECTGNAPLSEYCNDGIDNDCDGYADDQDTSFNSDYYESNDFTADCGACVNESIDEQSCGPGVNYEGVGLCNSGVETRTCGYDWGNDLWVYGEWEGCNATFPVSESGERCNDGDDNDCDGEVDSYDSDCGICLDGEEESGTCGETDEGLCEYGTHKRSCEFFSDIGNWSWGEWYNPDTGVVDDFNTADVDESCGGDYVAPEPEAADPGYNAPCNDEDDNDCDGLADSTDDECQNPLLTCTEGAQESQYCEYPEGLGECSTGGQFTANCIFDLSEGWWEYEEWTFDGDSDGSECSGATWSEEEICFNGLDDDCDGDTDEGCSSEDFVSYYVKNHYFISGAPPLTNNVRNGIENSLEVGGDGAAQIVYWDEVSESGQHLAHAKYVGVGGNCGYEGSPSNPQVVNNLYCEFIDVGDGGAVLIEQENDLVLDDNNNAHVVYMKTDWNNHPFFSLNYAEYVGTGGNCGYDSNLSNLAHTPTESINQKWNCNSLVEGDMMYSPNLMIVSGTPYFTYLIGTNLEVGNFVSESYSSLGSYDLGHDTSFGNLASHYEGEILYNLILTNNFKIIYVEYDISSGTFTSITVSEQINPAGVIGLTEIDLNVDSSGTVHIVYPSDYSEEIEGETLEKMKLVHKIKSGSSFVDYSPTSSVFDMDSGFDAQIEFTLDNLPVIAYETGLYNPIDPDAPVYSRLQSDEINWEHSSIEDSGVKSGHYIEIDLDSQNKIHSAFVRVRSSQDSEYLDFLTYSVMIPTA